MILTSSRRALALIVLLSTTACASYEAVPLNMGTVAVPTVRQADLPADGDVHSLLKLALAHDPAVDAARATMRSTEQMQKAAKNLPPLSLTLTAEYSKDSDPQKPWLYGGALGIPLDIGAKRQARVTAADLAVVKARYALAEAVWAVRQRLYTALSDLSLVQDELALSQTLFDQRLAYQAVMQKRVAAGEDAQGLAAQAALDVSGARQAMAQAQARRTQGLATLARALDSDVAAVACLPPVQMTGLDMLDDAQIATMTEKALYTRADVLLAVADYDMAENDLRQAVAAQYPDINIQPGYTWERGAVKLPLSLSLTLPPLDGNRAAINSAQAARLAAGKTLEDKVKTIQAAAVQASGAYSADLMTARTIRDQDLPMSRDMAARTERLKAAGEGDQSEALLAQLNATQTAIAALQAERTARTDRLTLEDALRQSFDAADTQILMEAVKVNP
jgi:CRISPR system Cascade subunit CasA